MTVRRALGLSTLVFAALWASPAWAQATFFPHVCPLVLFFDRCPAPARVREAPAPEEAGAPTRRAPTPAPEESPFAEPQVGPDGTLQVYLPPKAVREFLERPTPETARAYQQWTLERLRKVEAAQKVLDELNGVESGFSADIGALAGLALSPGPEDIRPGATLASPARPLPQPRPPLRPARGGASGAAGEPTGRTEVLYVLAIWCPYCAKQTPIMAAFARAHPEIRITGIALDSPPETIAPYAEGLPFPVRAGTDEDKAAWGIRVFPTIIVLQDGIPVRRITGQTGLQRLEALVGGARASRGEPP